MGRIQANPNVTNITSKTQSIYALNNIEITPQWLIDLGVRWDKFDTDVKYKRTQAQVQRSLKLAQNTAQAMTSLTIKQASHLNLLKMVLFI